MIDVIIVNWNSGNSLKGCIKSLALEFCRSIVVVDNASIDRSQECIQNMPQIELIQSKENLGFAKACNLGARKGSADWILFLNPDTIVPALTLDAVSLRLQDVAPIVGVIGVQLVDKVGEVSRSCSRIPNLFSMCFHSVGLDRVIPRLGYPMLDWDHKESRNVDHVMGSFYLIRRSLFMQLNGFDERFFLYLEDIDLSKRCLESGCAIQYWSDLQITHVGGGCSRTIKARRLFYDMRSRWVYSKKYFSFLPNLFVNAVILMVEPFVRCLYALVRISWKEFGEIIEAYGMMLRWVFRMRMHP